LSAEALEKFKIELKEWHNYNLELLKQSFNNPENDYKEEYQKSHHGMNFFGSHSLAGDVEDNKKKITNYIRGIEKILNKADLIPILGNAQKQGAN
jgi:hypothetical protein